MISRDLADFLESGISILIGTRDARLFPHCARGLGARVEKGGTELTVFLPDATCAPAVQNLRDNGRLAVCFSRPEDHRSIQVKGKVVELRAADDADRAVIDRYRRNLSECLGFVGVPKRTTFRISHWPAHAARVRIESVFLQTPGPGAGEPLALRKRGRSSGSGQGGGSSSGSSGERSSGNRK